MDPYYYFNYVEGPMMHLENIIQPTALARALARWCAPESEPGAAGGTDEAGRDGRSWTWSGTVETGLDAFARAVCEHDGKNPWIGRGFSFG